MAFLDDRDCTVPIVVPIDDLPAESDVTAIRTLAMIASDIIADAASVVLSRGRLGTGAVAEQDRRWASVLSRELAPVLGHWPIHLATPGQIQNR
jgi:hypothetical protein